MLRYALKSLYYRKIVAGFVIVAVIMSCLVSMLTVNVINQIEDNVFAQDKKYDLVIGAKGSSMELVMSSIFYSNSMLETIDYEIYENVNNVISKIPVAIADNYGSKNLYGTIPEFLNGYTFQYGRSFKNEFELVVGSEFAEKNRLKLGSKIITSHGAGEGTSSHEDNPYTVVGILNRTGTAIDEAILTSIESIWHAHNHEENEGFLIKEEDHEHEEHGEITAILIKTGNLNTYNNIITDIGKTDNLQAVSVTNTLRNILSNVGISVDIIKALGIIIFMLCILIILMSLSLYINKLCIDISCMKRAELRKNNIFLYSTYQIIIILVISFIGIIIARQGFLSYAKGIAEQFGVIINQTKIYIDEIKYLIVMLLIILAPTSLITIKEIHK